MQKVVVQFKIPVNYSDERISRKGAKKNLNLFFAPLRLCGRRFFSLYQNAKRTAN